MLWAVGWRAGYRENRLGAQGGRNGDKKNLSEVLDPYAHSGTRHEYSHTPR